MVQKKISTTATRRAATRERKRAAQKKMRVSGKSVFTINRLLNK